MLTGWLNTYHTFSFAGYHDSKYSNFHSLRVINEDRVTVLVLYTCLDHFASFRLLCLCGQGGEGFGTHPHSEYEIFSYVVSGALRHQDSMGNNEIIPRGTVQFTSAGRGISHSEYNASDDELVHFIQMWVKPNQRGLKPSYQTKSFSDAEKRGALRVIVSPDGHDRSVKIHQQFSLYASLLARGETVTLRADPNSDYYVHVIQDVSDFAKERNEVGVTVNGEVLRSGDGMFLRRRRSTANSNSNATAQVTATLLADEDASITFQGASVNDKLVEFLVFEVQRDS